MLEFLLAVLVIYLVADRFNALKKHLLERIADLENQVKFLNDKVNALKRNIDRQNRSEAAAARTKDVATAEKALPENVAEPGNSPKPTRKTPAEVDSEKLRPTEPATGKPSFQSSQPISAFSDKKPAADFSGLSFDQPGKEVSGQNTEGYEWLKKSREDTTERHSGAVHTDSSAASNEKTEDRTSETAEKTIAPDISDRKAELNSDPGAKTSGTGKAAHGGPGGPGGPKKPENPPDDWGEGWRRFKSSVDWEQFTGAMLFAWLGGLALFIGAGFFVKYSIDKNLISPVMRLVIGALVGLGMIGGSFRFERGRYDTMRQTFAAGGVGVLYSVFFAATLYYEYLPKPAGFAALSIVSAAAFVLALFHRGVAISVLGGVGAYLTPLLVTTGQGGLLSLFTYLSVVNIGLFQVVRRLESNALLLFASIGTMFSLGCGTFLADPLPEGMPIFIAWSANLALFAFFLDRIKGDPVVSTSIRCTGIAIFSVSAAIALLVTLGYTSSAPMAMMAAAMTIATALAFRQSAWHEMVIPYAAITFLVSAFWALTRFNAGSSHWAFLAFFVYGIAGGIGPVLLISRNGISQRFLTWFRVFPVALAALLLLTLVVTPQMSFMFWPLTIALQLVGIFVSMIFGAIPQLFAMTVILVIAAIIWLTAGSPVALPLAFYGFLLVAGALVVLATFYCLAKVAEWGATLKLSPEITDKARLNPAMTEWMSSAPIIGIFVLLGLAFSMPGQINASPGMLTLVCFMAIAIALSRRLKFEYMGAITLLTAGFAQAFWALRPDLASAGQPFVSMLWSGGLYIASLILPFVLFKDFAVSRRIWMSWSIFELAQALFFVYAADKMWQREISGWIPVVLACLKFPAVSALVSQLAGRAERNSILACHGGVLLFYISLTPFLLLETGWLGLVLVLESVGLLWLNHRVEHNGLRRVAAVMAPVGLYLLLSWLPQMKGPESIIILNPAVISVLVAVIAMFGAVRLAPHPDDRLWKWNITNYFTWIAVLTGFYFVNLVVADIFTGSHVATGSTIRFIPMAGDILHRIVYTTLWALFGAILWKRQDLHIAVRIFGLILLGLGVFWLIMFPFNYGYAVAAMAPLFNIGMLAYLPIMLILLYLFMTEPWGATSVSIKNFFLAMLLITGFLALKVIKATIFQAGQPLDLFQAKTASMAVASAAGWIVYGLAMLVWPKRLDRPFRIAGLILMSLGLLRTVLFPFRFAVDFGAMTPLMNRPTLLFAFAIGVLIWLTRRRQDASWPLQSVDSQPLFATMLALMVFYVLNVEIASVFGHRERAFSLLTRGSLAHQLGYSLGWLVYAIGLLASGIRWNQVRARQAALILILVTSAKIFLKDLWDLGQLYRVASFIGLAAVLMLVSYLYQRFLAKSGVNANEK